MSKKMICPHCGGASGFDVLEEWPPLSYLVAGDGTVTEYDSDGQRSYTVMCVKCKAVIDGKLAGTIADLVASI